MCGLIVQLPGDHYIFATSLPTLFHIGGGLVPGIERPSTQAAVSSKLILGKRDGEIVHFSQAYGPLSNWSLHRHRGIHYGWGLISTPYAHQEVCKTKLDVHATLKSSKASYLPRGGFPICIQMHCTNLVCTIRNLCNSHAMLKKHK